MAGLKICTRWRAISARRRRRISSSLLPENIGPTTTSIQPIFPLTISTRAPRRLDGLENWPLRLRRSSGNLLVHLAIVKRRKGGNKGKAKGFLARNETTREHPPSSFGVAKANGPGKSVDGNRQLDAEVEHFVC